MDVTIYTSWDVATAFVNDRSTYFSQNHFLVRVVATIQKYW